MEAALGVSLDGIVCRHGGVICFSIYQPEFPWKNGPKKSPEKRLWMR